MNVNATLDKIKEMHLYGFERAYKTMYESANQESSQAMNLLLI